MKKIALLGLLCSLFLAMPSVAQEAAQAVSWKASSLKTGNNKYQLTFSSANKNGWDIYAPDANFEGIPSGGLVLPDSSIVITKALKAKTKGELVKSILFEGLSFEVFKKEVEFVAEIEFPNAVPAKLLVSLNYTYGKGDSFFPGEVAAFEVALEGGSQAESRMLIPGLDPGKPLQNCGTEASKEDNSPLTIFLLGFLGGAFCIAHTLCIPNGTTDSFLFYQTWK